MNRSLLIATCDFMILSIIGIANFSDTPGDSKEESPIVSISEELEQSLETSLKEASQNSKELKDHLNKKEQDLIESKKREQALANAKKALENKLKNEAAKLSQKEKQLSDKEKSLATSKKREKEKLALLEKEKQKVNEQNRKLINLDSDLKNKNREIDAQLKQLALAKEKSNALSQLHQSLNKQIKAEQLRLKNKDLELQSSTEESKQRQAEQLKQLNEIAKLKLQMQKLKSNNQQQNSSSEFLKQELIALRKQKVETEILLKKLDRVNESVGLNNKNITQSMQNIIKQSSTELENKIGENNKNLIVKIDKTISKNQPKSMHSVFEQYRDRKVILTINAIEKGIFGQKKINKEIPGVVFSTKDKDYALIFAKNSPLMWNHFLDKYHSLSIHIKGTKNSITHLHTFKDDPRVILAELNSTTERSFKVSKQVYKYNNAVLVNPKNSQYGQFPLQLTGKNSRIISLPSSVSTRLFGKLSPTGGLYVFSLNGDIIGMTTSQGKCLALHDFKLEESFPLNKLNTKVSQRQFQKWEERIKSLN